MSVAFHANLYSISIPYQDTPLSYFPAMLQRSNYFIRCAPSLTAVYTTGLLRTLILPNVSQYVMTKI